MQMAASPALVPSPGGLQHTPMSNQQRSAGWVSAGGMAPSPSSSLNTPGGAGAVASPSCSQQEDQAYRDKVRQLSKYIDPLRKMINRMGNDGEHVEKLSKMKKLLEILSNPNKRAPIETLIKCEIVLEKLDFKRGETVPPPNVPMQKELHIFNPLLEAVTAALHSPMVNHTLHRTFAPSIEAIFGPEIKNMPEPLPKKKMEEPPNDIPDVLQGEIARLDQKFKVILDSCQQQGSRSVQLVCWLDDKHLPCVPPISLTVPENYPNEPPRCHMVPFEYQATPFLSAVQSALEARILRLPGVYSVSQLLDTWEMSVRQASGPAKTMVQPTEQSVLLGL